MGTKDDATLEEVAEAFADGRKVWAKARQFGTGIWLCSWRQVRIDDEGRVIWADSDIPMEQRLDRPWRIELPAPRTKEVRRKVEPEDAWLWAHGFMLDGWLGRKDFAGFEYEGSDLRYASPIAWRDEDETLWGWENGTRTLVRPIAVWQIVEEE